MPPGRQMRISVASTDKTEDAESVWTEAITVVGQSRDSFIASAAHCN
jgi:hypothetical protein